MGYNVADIIEKTINIAVRRRAIYENIGQEKGDILPIKIISKVLVKQLDKTIEYYKILLKEVNDVEFEEIAFSIYDKMSSMIYDFNTRINLTEINGVREYLDFSLGFEKAVYSLLMDMQGRLVRNTDDIHTKTYKILSDIIENKARHIDMLERM